MAVTENHVGQSVEDSSLSTLEASIEDPELAWSVCIGPLRCATWYPKCAVDGRFGLVMRTLVILS